MNKYGPLGVGNPPLNVAPQPAQVRGLVHMLRLPDSYGVSMTWPTQCVFSALVITRMQDSCESHKATPGVTIST